MLNNLTDILIQFPIVWLDYSSGWVKMHLVIWWHDQQLFPLFLFFISFGSRKIFSQSIESTQHEDLETEFDTIITQSESKTQKHSFFFSFVSSSYTQGFITWPCSNLWLDLYFLAFLFSKQGYKLVRIHLVLFSGQALCISTDGRIQLLRHLKNSRDKCACHFYPNI